jgi:RNA polymerase sigma-70 factor (ECF subfamily)
MLAGLEGDRASYRLLLTELRPRLSAYFARRLHGDSSSIEDLVQDTLLSIHTRRETYNVTEAFTPWAYAIARYKLIDHYRRLKRRVHVPIENASAVFVEDETEASDARRDIEAVLLRLPEKTRALLRSVKLDELSHAEAGERAGMSEGAVKVAVHRAMKVLAAQFSSKETEHDR